MKYKYERYNAVKSWSDVTQTPTSAEIPISNIPNELAIPFANMSFSVTNGYYQYSGIVSNLINVSAGNSYVPINDLRLLSNQSVVRVFVKESAYYTWYKLFRYYTWVKDSYIDSIISEEGIYPDNGAMPSDDYKTAIWYIKVAKINKYLIKQGTQYYSIKNNTLTLLGVPTDDTQKEKWFNDDGVDDLKSALLTKQSDGSKLIDKLDDKFEIRMMKAKD